MSDSESGSKVAEPPKHPRSKQATHAKTAGIKKRVAVDSPPAGSVQLPGSEQTEGSSAMKTVGDDAPTDPGEVLKPQVPAKPDEFATELYRHHVDKWITQALLGGTRQPK